MPLVFGIFIIFRFFFHLTSKYKISLLFREYDFNIFFTIMLMEGNLESFTYFIVYDCLQMGGKEHASKIIHFATIFIGFFFFVYVFAAFFLIQILLRSKSKHILTDFKINVNSLLVATMQNGLLSFALGSIHILMENEYHQQLGLLLKI